MHIQDFNFIPNTPEFHTTIATKSSTPPPARDDKLHNVFELHLHRTAQIYQTLPRNHDCAGSLECLSTKVHQLGKHDVPEQLRGDSAIVKAITAVDRMFDEDERMIYETRMQALADVESKIASAEGKVLEKGMEKGSENEAKMLLQRALHKRFGNRMDTALQAKINQVSLTEIEVWFERVFDATSLENVCKEPK